MLMTDKIYTVDERRFTVSAPVYFQIGNIGQQIIEDAFTIRNASDYDDMFIASKTDTETQISNAEFMCKKIEEYINNDIHCVERIKTEEG